MLIDRLNEEALVAITNEDGGRVRRPQDQLNTQGGPENGLYRDEKGLVGAR